MCLQPASHGLPKDCSSHKGFSPGRAFSEKITPSAPRFVRISFNWLSGWEIRKNTGQVSPGGVTARTDLTPKWERVFKRKGKSFLKRWSRARSLYFKETATQWASDWAALLQQPSPRTARGPRVTITAGRCHKQDMDMWMRTQTSSTSHQSRAISATEACLFPLPAQSLLVCHMSDVALPSEFTYVSSTLSKALTSQPTCNFNRDLQARS